VSQLLDFLPILLFVAAFFAFDIYWATAALMIAVTAQLVLYKLFGKPIGKELWLTFWVSLVFGGLTLVLRDETFIQWKPTIVNWALAGVLIGGHFTHRNFVARMLSHQLDLPDREWTRLNFGWAFGFFLAGALNLVVAYNFSMEFWVTYKLVGGFALTLLYIIVTAVYLARKGQLVPKESTGA
jgi:intracellular septation protein